MLPLNNARGSSDSYGRCQGRSIRAARRREYVRFLNMIRSFPEWDADMVASRLLAKPGVQQQIGKRIGHWTRRAANANRWRIRHDPATYARISARWPPSR